MAQVFSRGISEVGVVIGSTDTPFGKTQQVGFSIQMNVTTVDLLSAQSKMVEDTGITQVGMDLQINGIDGSLENIGRMFGMPAGAFSGGPLPGSAEVLDFMENDIGEEEQAIYAVGFGGQGVIRRVDAPRAKLANVGPLTMASTEWMVPTATWRVLNPNTTVGGTMPVLTITDSAAS